MKLDRARQNSQKAIKAWRDLDAMGTRMAATKIRLLERDNASLRAELAELKARRCETCAHYIGHLSNGHAALRPCMREHREATLGWSCPEWATKG